MHNWICIAGESCDNNQRVNKSGMDSELFSSCFMTFLHLFVTGHFVCCDILKVIGMLLFLTIAPIPTYVLQPHKNLCSYCCVSHGGISPTIALISWFLILIITSSIVILGRSYCFDVSRISFSQ